MGTSSKLTPEACEEAVRLELEGREEPVTHPRLSEMTGLSRSDTAVGISRLRRKGLLEFGGLDGWVLR